MDGYQLIASLFQSLMSAAWPAAFAFAAWLFKDKLAALLPLLHLKYKELDVSFRLQEAEKEVAALPPVEEPSEPTYEETEKFGQLAKTAPAWAIAEKGLAIEQALSEFGRTIGVKEPRIKGWTGWTRALRKESLIDSATAAVLDDLRAVRNSAVHGGDTMVTEHDALRFAAVADRLIESLQIKTAAASHAGMPVPLP
jgi:hypothetical protein